jgi:hypothetical protein
MNLWSNGPSSGHHCRQVRAKLSNKYIGLFPSDIRVGACDCCLAPTQQFSSWPDQVNFHRDDDEVHFVLDQHTLLDFYSASSLKQQSANRHVAPLVHIIPITNQPVFA